MTLLFISALTMQSPAIGQTFTLHDGTSIEGNVVAATNNTISILETGRTIVSLSLGDIREVQLPISGREQDLKAEIVGWDSGIYELVTEQHSLRVADGEIVTISDREVGAGGPVRDTRRPDAEGLPVPGILEDRTRDGSQSSKQRPVM